MVLTMPTLNTHRYCTLKKSSLPGLTVSKTRYVAGRLPTHSHVHARLVFVVTGEFTEDCYGRRECRAGMVLFRPPGELHAERFGPRSSTSISVDIEPQWLDRLRQSGLALAHSVSLRSKVSAQLAERLDREIEAHDPASGIAIEAIVLESAVAASRHTEDVSERRAPPWLGRAITFLRAELSRPVTLTEIGQAAGVHPAHFARVFRTTHGCSVGAYLRHLRVQEARRALETSHAPLADIAASAGFADQSHLCRAFKDIIGITPGRYRTLARQR
jgi:AraC family transcriptional regulator